jgi:1-acyl-sn-glycerol-3-phosphate acyltransferase
MVNFEAMQRVREIAKRDAVVFMPTHRTYVDFLLISLLCYDQNLKLPAICAGADFLSSKFVGEALRRCGAFFIRRSFGSVSFNFCKGLLQFQPQFIFKRKLTKSTKRQKSHLHATSVHTLRKALCSL